MSDMEAIHIKVVVCSQQEADKHYMNKYTLDEYELYDYNSEHGLIDIAGVLWKYVEKKQLNPCGFTHVLDKTEESCEMIAYFYNGGVHEDEIVRKIVNSL